MRRTNPHLRTRHRGPADDACRAPTLDQHTLYEAADHELGAGGRGVRKVGLDRRLLGARLAAEAHVGGGRRVVAGAIGVPVRHGERPVQCLCAALHRLMGLVKVAAVGAHRQPRADGVEVTIEVVGHVGQAMLGGPFAPDPLLGADAVGPVDHSSPAQA